MGKSWCIDPINGLNTNGGDSWSVEASGSDGVTDGGTTFTTATGGLTGMEGRAIQIATLWKRLIVSVESDTSCTLNDTCSSGSNREWFIGGPAQSYQGLPYSIIQSGDLVKYAKTSGWDSAGTITYTSKSDEVVIGSGRVALIDDCESLWTAADANVTIAQETSAYYKQFGSYALKATVATAFTTGKMAYFDFGAGNEKDLSAFQGASLLFRSSININAGCLQLCLCSDATGDVVVDTIDLMPGSTNLYSNVIHILKGLKSGGGDLGSSIRSIALYAAVDPGGSTFIFYVDNIYAILDDSNANHICHNCLIGQGNTIADPMWAVLGFTDETHVKLTGEWYGGTEGAVASYRVEPAFLWGTGVTSAVGVYTSYNPQHEDEVINSGGWDPGTDTQDGVTCIRMMPSSTNDAYCRWMGPGSHSFWVLENFIFPQGFQPTKYRDQMKLRNCGFVGTTTQSSPGLKLTSSNSADGTMFRFDLKNIWVTAMPTYGLYAPASGTVGTYTDAFLDFTWENVTVYSTAGVSTADMKRFRGKNLKFCNNGGTMVWRINNAVVDMDIVGLTLKDNRASSDAAMHFDRSAGRVRIWDLVASDNDNATFNTSHVEIICYNPDVSDAVLYKTDDFLALGKMAMFKQGGGATDHIIYTWLGTISSELSVRHTASDIAWKFSPTNANGIPMQHKLAEVALEAGVPATIGLYMRRDSTDAHGRLRIMGGWLLGMSEDDYTDDLEAAANIWELVSVSITPTETGVVEVWVEAWGGTTNNVYVDDLSVTV